MTTSAPSGARYGVTSMVAPLKRVLVRKPATSGDWAGAGWRTPDPATLERQHAQFVELLDQLGAEVELAEALDGQVDSVYMHDPLIMSGRGGIPLNMAKPARMKEPAAARQEFERLDIPVVGTLEGDAYADGGDRFWLDDTTAAIGLGYRTNKAGAHALQELLRPESIHVEAYDMPHDQGPDPPWWPGPCCVAIRMPPSAPASGCGSPAPTQHRSGGLPRPLWTREPDPGLAVPPLPLAHPRGRPPRLRRP